MPVIAVVVGALAGAVLGNGFFASLVGALLAWLLVRSMAQQQQIRLLQEAMTLKREALTAEERHEVATDTDAAMPMLRATTDPIPELHAEVATTAASELPVLTPATQGTLPLPSHPEPAAAPSEPGLFDRARAWLLGGNTIAKAGIGILFIGLAFLAKYASDHALLPVEFRLAGIGGVALVLLGLGWRLRTARPAYAQALQGGAVAVLYLTLFVAFRFYGVLAFGPVFALMVLVAGLAAALAVLQNARGLAVIGALGGFATPLLVSSGGGSHLALFSYYLVLDLGIAAVAWYRNWPLLNAVGFLFTFGVSTAWGVVKYEPSNYAVAQGFLLAYFLLFNAVLLMPARRLALEASRSDAWVNGGLLFGLPTLSFVLQHGLMRDTAYGTALSALGLAAFYVVLAMRMQKNVAMAVLFDATLAIATVFVSLVIPFALDARSTGGAWALEGAGLLWLGFRQQRRLPRLFGYALLLIAGITLVMARQWHGAPTAVFNAWFLNALLLAVGALAGAFFVHRGMAGDKGMPGEALAQALLIGWGLLWALGAAALEIDLFATERQSVTAWLVALSIITLACALAALRLRWRNVGLPLMALAPALLLLAVAGLALLDNPAQQGGFWAWPLALAVQGLVLRRLAPSWPAGPRHAVHAIGPLVLAVLGAQWGGDITSGWGDMATAWPWLGTLAVPALLLLVLRRGAVATRWPVSAEPAAYQATAGAVLTVALLNRPGF